MSDTQYDPVGDIPDQTGRVFVITGGQSAFICLLVQLV